jgi:hypothetical protein
VITCARRNNSVTAPQALLLMNNAAVRIHAHKFAERLRREAAESPEAQIRRGFELGLSRPPQRSELADSPRFLDAGADALTDFCHALFNLNEFVYQP